jgi:hypothetical protein
VMILFDRRLGTASFQPCGFFGVSLINEAGRWRAVIARGMKSSADRQGIACAVSPYRSKFSDCPTDAVPNSYPKLDLLWDNVMRGHGDGPALQC